MPPSYQHVKVSKLQRILAFILSRLFLIQVLIAIAISALLIYASLQYIEHYTLHGEEITVPDLTGMEKSELKEFLTEKNLTFRIIDSSYNTAEEKGKVLAQNPSPLSKVKKDRTIYITVNAMNPPSVRLPLLIDKSMRQAKSMIENVGLKLGNIQYQPDQCVNCVLAQSVNGKKLKGDTILPKGYLVDLTLGGGLSDEKVLVPLLINLTRSEAMDRLSKSFLNLGAEVFDESVFDATDSTEARIYVQYPEYSAKSWLQMGSSVDVEYTTLENKIDTNIVILDSSLFKTNVDTDSL